MTILTQTQPSVNTQINPRLHLSAIYQDSIGFQIIVHWYGVAKAIDISSASGNNIFAAAMLAEAIESSEGYDEDLTAQIHFLHPNEFANLLNRDELEALKQFQWDAQPRATERSRHIVSGRYR